MTRPGGDVWPGGKFNTDSRRLCDFLERIGAVTCSSLTPPSTGNDREREIENIGS